MTSHIYQITKKVSVFLPEQKENGVIVQKLAIMLVGEIRRLISLFIKSLSYPLFCSWSILVF